jgi:hypothetical protein
VGVFIEVLRPCCDWRRSCSVTRITVYDVTTGVVDEEIYPWRCWRANVEGEPTRRIVIIGFDPAKHLVFYHHRTESDNGVIIFYNIPPLLTLQEATEFIRRKWGYKNVYATIAKPVFDDSHLYFQHCYKPLIL